MPLLPPLKSWSRSLLCTVSLLGAILLHLIIFGLFSLRQTTVKAAEKHTESACTTFSTDNGRAEWEQQLSDFCEIHDPSLLTQANTSHGFSSWLLQPPPPPLSNTSLPAPAPAKQQTSLFPPSAIADSLPPVPEAIGQHWPTSIQNHQEKIPSKSLPSGTIWRFADGALLVPPPDIPDEITAKAAADTTPTRSSQFEVRLPQNAFRARIRLTDSCGNPKLDKLALLALSARLRQWEQARLTRKADPESVRFVASNDFTQLIEVEWRLRPASP